MIPSSDDKWNNGFILILLSIHKNAAHKLLAFHHTWIEEDDSFQSQFKAQ